MHRLAEPDGRPELLALRALKLGDLLVAVPALRGLRAAFPGHRVVLAVPGWLEPVVDLVPGVDALLPTPGLDDPLPLQPGRVDLAVNLHGNGAESRTRIEELGARERFVHRVAGFPSRAHDPEWAPELHERERWVRLVRSYGVVADPLDVALLPSSRRPGPAGAAVVHVGAFHGSRAWPVDRFAAVATHLRQRGESVVLTGGGADRSRALAVADAAGVGAESVLAGALDLDEFAAVVEEARVVVTVDTGAAHLASAYGTPSVVIFGPAPPEVWGPPPGPHVVLTDAAQRRGDVFAEDPDPALLAVTAPEVVAAVERLLAD